MFQHLHRVVRAEQLYSGRGVLLEQLRSTLHPIVRSLTEHAPVHLRLSSRGLAFDGVRISGGEPPRYLFTLFCDGLRSLTLMPGITAAELDQLASILASDGQGQEESLTSQLWRADLPHLRMHVIDTIGQGLSLGGHLLAHTEQAASSGATVKLSEQDIALLGEERAPPWLSECQAPAPLRPRGSCSLEQGDALMKLAQLTGPGPMTPFMSAALDRRLQRRGADDARLVTLLLPDSAPTQRIIAVLSPPRLAWIVPLLTDEAEAWMPLLLRRARAQPGDVALWTSLLALVEEDTLWAALLEALLESGVDLRELALSCLADPREGALPRALAVLELATRRQLPLATALLQQALADHRPALCQAALSAIEVRYRSDLRTNIVRTMLLGDPQSRAQAARLLSRSRDPEAARLLLRAAQDRRLLTREPSEQRTIFQACGRAGGREIQHYLETLMATSRPLQDATTRLRQGLAIDALVEMNTPWARTLLLKSSQRRSLSRELRQRAAAASSRRR